MDILKLDKLKEDGREVEQIQNKDIYIIKDFLGEGEHQYIYSKLKELKLEDFQKSYFENHVKHFAERTFGSSDLEQLIKDGVIEERDERFNWYWEDKIYFLRDISNKMEQKIADRLKQYLEDDYDFGALSTIQRHGKGQSLGYHFDNETQEGIKYAVVLYLNDDFEGGLLHFPNKEDVKRVGGSWELITEELEGFVIKPKAGNLIIFSTTEDYVHGVTAVESDDSRYALVTFIR